MTKETQFCNIRKYKPSSYFKIVKNKKCFGKSDTKLNTYGYDFLP